ncbi:MAG: ShlB/FhaC/HecB family hemolysin secretion/activation protein [Steroidobacteraceae bacterium]
MRALPRATVVLIGAFLALTGVLADAQTAPAPADTKPEQHFHIAEFRVLGNSLLPNRDIERAVYPFLGPNRDLDVVKKASEALEKAYKDAGYGTIFVDIPEQSVDSGIVRLRVTEGRLDRIRVKGERYVSGRQIRAALPALVPGETPHLPAFQQELTVLNARTPDVVVTPVLKAGREPGTVDLDLDVKDTLPLHASVEVNNRYSPDTTPNRVALSASYDNLWQLNHSLSLQYQTAPARTADAKIEAASYLIQPEGAHSIWAFSFIHTSSDVATLATLGVLGKGSIYGIRWIDPLVNTDAAAHSITLGLDYKTFGEDVRLSGSPGLDTPIKYLHWSAQYSGSWRLPATAVGFTGGLGFGIRDLINKPEDFESKRFDAPAGYFYLRSTGQVLQALPKGFAVLVRYNGQWTPNPLIDNEQLALGGLDTVRGYLEAETLGDYGLAGTLEVHSPMLGDRLGSMLRPLYGFMFGDAGIVALQQPLPAQAYRSHIGSAGFGLRLEANSGLFGTLDYAVPLVDGPRTHHGDPRVDFSIHYGF